MNRWIAFVVILTAMLPALCGFAAAPAQVSDEAILKEASEAFKGADWDRAESLYRRASQSPDVETRILAYEGLRVLYRKMRSPKKRQNAEWRLEKEKKFFELLVPVTLEHYEAYTVRPGDSYHKLAVSRGVSEEWLTKINGRKKLVPGERILMPRDQDNLFIDKQQRKLFWFRGQEIIKVYPIAVGKKETETPEGDYRIVEKIANPTWYKEHEIIPPGDPKNLLGTRWLGLDHKGYGIHGTKNPHSIGSAASHGCIRMFNRDVEELFEWIPMKTRVLIQNASVADEALYPI